MPRDLSLLADTLKDWIFAILVLIATFIMIAAARAILRRLNKTIQFKPLDRLIPAVSNFLYILGFKLFIDFAPISGKIGYWADSGVFILAVIIPLRLIRQAALFGMQWSTEKIRDSDTLQQGFVPLLRNLITLFIFLTGGIIILKHFNYDVMSLVTALGVGSLAVGLAAKDTLSHMISGFILIIDRNLRPGDRINLSGMVGDITEIGLRSTRIKLMEGNTLIVPNSELVNTKILNLCVPSRATACTTQIRIPYSAPFPNTKSICLAVINQVEKISKQRPTWVNLNSLSEGHQIIQIGFWISELSESNAIISEFHEKLLKRLNEEQITLLPPAWPAQMNSVVAR